ncbi:hypothetical protein DY000_02029359 [Brassica cretica]|uniref:Uncharacterized protein n=1 Tax=Brassica cretica TaxID=69181 RepID=A0ABQ7DL31_BRACR|nr:hypothetical protein DY000_02029359 [Brassica cretica]
MLEARWQPPRCRFLHRLRQGKETYSRSWIHELLVFVPDARAGGQLGEVQGPKKGL